MPESQTPGTGDDPLLNLLAAAMAPADTTPPEATVVALRTAVASMSPAPARRRTLAGWTGWRGRRWAVAGAVVATVTLGTGTAFAAGIPVPPPIRILATDIGLPVTPQPVVNVQNAVSSLQTQLQSTPPDPARTAAAAGKLSTLIHQLDPAQRNQVGALPTQVLQQACRAVYPTTGLSAAPVGGWSGCPTTAPAGSPSPGPATGSSLPTTTSTTVSGGSTGGTAPARPGGWNPSGNPTTGPAGGSTPSGTHPWPPTTSVPGRGSGGGSGGWGPGSGSGSGSGGGAGRGSGGGSGRRSGTDVGPGKDTGTDTDTANGPESASSETSGDRPPAQDTTGSWGQGSPGQPHQQASPVPIRSAPVPSPGAAGSPGVTPG
ncbi:MAG: hypothetical protein ABSB09_10865 [Acidimicrobiales bacterium]|jgi:hypothetical protein